MRNRVYALAALMLSLMVASAEARDHDRKRDRDRDREVKIRCESVGEKYSYCPTKTQGNVEIVKQLSKTDCREYDTWGSTGGGSGVWVRNGCRADFVVREDRRWGRGRDRDRDRDRDGEVTRLRCASEDWSYQHCDVRGRVGEARVVKQISKTKCDRDDNWGIDRRGIWVDRGCAAEFEVQER